MVCAQQVLVFFSSKLNACSGNQSAHVGNTLKIFANLPMMKNQVSGLVRLGLQGTQLLIQKSLLQMVSCHFHFSCDSLRGEDTELHSVLCTQEFMSSEKEINVCILFLQNPKMTFYHITSFQQHFPAPQHHHTLLGVPTIQVTQSIRVTFKNIFCLLHTQSSAKAGSRLHSLICVFPLPWVVYETVHADQNPCCAVC